MAVNQSWPCLGLSLLIVGLSSELSYARTVSSNLNYETPSTTQALLYAQAVGATEESGANPPTPVRSQNGLLITAPINSETSDSSQNPAHGSFPATRPTVSNSPIPVRSQNGLLINTPVINPEASDGNQNLVPVPIATLEAVTVNNNEILLIISGADIPCQTRIAHDPQTQKVTLIVEQTQLSPFVPTNPSHSSTILSSLQINSRPDVDIVEISFNSPSLDWQVKELPNGLSFALANAENLAAIQSSPTAQTITSSQTSPTPESSAWASIPQASRPQEQPVSPIVTPTDPNPPAENSTPTPELPSNQTEVLGDPEQAPPPQQVFNPPSPLYNQQFQFPTAFQPRGGDVVQSFSFRASFPPESIIPNSSYSVNAGSTVTWAVTDTTALSFSFHRIDSSFPGTQGNFLVRQEGGSTWGAADNGFALQVQQQIWKNEEETQAVGAVLSLAFGNYKSNFANQQTGQNTLYEYSTVTPVLQFPYTIAPDPAWQFTITPTVAFFSGDSAMFYHTAPMDNPGAFGTNFGFTSGVSYSVNERFTLWGDAFFPLAGNNSINRSTGQAAQAIVYNAGVRYFVNPRLAMDIYASNSLGTMGAIGLTGDRDLMSIGANLVFMPSRTGSDRYKDSFSDENVVTPWLEGGFSLLDGGVLPSKTLLVDVAGGNQGFNGILNYAYLNDLDLGIYLGYATGIVDESEQGLSARVRLVNQYEGQPLTATLVGTLGKTNQPFVNYVNNNRNEFTARGLEKSVPFVTNVDNGATGELWIITASLPLQYQFDLEAVNSSAIWLTPIVGFVQRVDGLPMAGINVGGSYAFLEEFSLIGELGVTFGGQGNMFNGDTLSYALPWTLGLRWNPSNFIGKFSFYVTNRVGLTPWQQMRVRDGDGIAVGVGMSFPIPLP